MSLTSGKIAEILFENALQTYEHQMTMFDLVERFEPSSADMQNAGNVIWRPVQQHAPIVEGWDLSAYTDRDVIEETYPAILGMPKNDLFEQRADNLRDMRFWERRGGESGRKQAAELNKNIASAIASQGSIFYQTNATSGYDAIAEAEAILDERQKRSDDPRFMVLNNRDKLKYASDLAARQTVIDRPEDVWGMSEIGPVANFRTFTGSFLPTLAGAAGANTLSAVYNGKPEGGTVNTTTGVVTNVDYRTATISLTSAAAFLVGDRCTIANVDAVGMSDKTLTNQLMTFVIVAKTGNDITIYPKPISINDGTLTTIEKAYGNVDTNPANGAAITKINTTASAKQNIFGCKTAVEVTSGDAPVQLLNQFGGMKVISSTMKNGQKMYMAYDGNIEKLTFICRLFTWHAVTVADPSACGSFTTF